MARISNERAISKLRTIVATDGPRAALIYLNSLCGHRFSALYLFDGDALRNLYFYDREQPEVETTDEIPVTASYCVFVRQTGQLFHTSDALRDERVREHPKREKIQSYCGVPLLDRAGSMFGSICHFDVAPRIISDEDVDLLEAFGRMLQDEERIRARLVPLPLTAAA
jgi:GAF domain-containing protein